MTQLLNLDGYFARLGYAGACRASCDTLERRVAAGGRVIEVKCVDLVRLGWCDGEVRIGPAVACLRADARPFVRGIVERFRSQTRGLSQAEIHPRARLKTVGRI